ncbi:MAG: hypothetical protein Hens3KO_22150 [Henriciella sp.]
MSRKLICALAYACLLPVAALAQDAIMTEDERLVTGILLEDLKAITSDLGHTVSSENSDSVLITVKTEEDFIYSMHGAACDDSGLCKGINMMASYSAIEGMTLESINAANTAYAAANIWSSDGSLVISRYLILDGGMTISNIKANINTLLAIAPMALEKARESTLKDTPDIIYGDDSGDYALDDACDDARFHVDGDDYSYKREHVMHDATDCRNDVEAGTVSMILDFGDNLGEYADDGTCDDVRFEGEGRSILVTDSHIKKDAADCIAAYQAGTISVR